MILRTVICEDEKETRAYLSSLIREQHIPCEIVEYASAGECLSDEKMDLLFLDIELNPSGEGAEGIALAQEIRRQDRKVQPVIIFVSGYDRYVFDAFDVDAFQYLIKPVDEEKFARVFGRAAKRILAERQNSGGDCVVTLRSANSVRSVPFHHIRYIESSNHKVILHLKDGEFACYAKIRDLEEELGDRFFRIHKGYLVNLACVERYGRTEAVLKSGEKILISKYRYRDFVRAYLRFLQKEAGL